MSVIFMSTLFYKALISQVESWCWSLLGLKGLSYITKAYLIAERAENIKLKRQNDY